MLMLSGFYPKFDITFSLSSIHIKPFFFSFLTYQSPVGIYDDSMTEEGIHVDQQLVIKSTSQFICNTSKISLCILTSKRSKCQYQAKLQIYCFFCHHASPNHFGCHTNLSDTNMKELYN